MLIQPLRYFETLVNTNVRQYGALLLVHVEQEQDCNASAQAAANTFSFWLTEFVRCARSLRLMLTVGDCTRPFNNHCNSYS